MVSNNYTPEIVEALNDLLGSFFQMNSASDNMAYALDCELNCPCASQVFHSKFAHVFPSDTFADKLSEIMIQEGIALFVSLLTVMKILMKISNCCLTMPTQKWIL